MLSFFRSIIEWFKSLFWKEEMEITLVGLQNSGKTTFVNVIAVRTRRVARVSPRCARPADAVPPGGDRQSGQFSEDMIPTVGFNMRKISKGNVTIKMWDIGGQPRFRGMWERYCRGVNCIVYADRGARRDSRRTLTRACAPRSYMVDAADVDKIEASRTELHALLEKPQLNGIPVLVLGNKNDLPDALSVEELIERLNLKAIGNREVCCYSISCKNQVNIDITLQWLIRHSSPK